MSMFQTLLALVVLIFVLSVIVQALQEVLKSMADAKASTMAETIRKFMGDHLPLAQVQAALQTRGLEITALEHFTKDDFRHLLDGIQLASPQVQGIVVAANATVEQAKDNIAAAYEGAMVAFQKSYTNKNKKCVIGLSFLIVLALNASLIPIYETLAVNQNLSQAISGTAATIISSQKPAQNPAGVSSAPSLQEVYQANRETITKDLQKYPILLRTLDYPEDFRKGAVNEIAGLLLMGMLVSLGAPFWNDVLKGMMGVNNVLNTSGKRA